MNRTTITALTIALVCCMIFGLVSASESEQNARPNAAATASETQFLSENVPLTNMTNPQLSKVAAGTSACYICSYPCGAYYCCTGPYPQSCYFNGGCYCCSS